MVTGIICTLDIDNVSGKVTISNVTGTINTTAYGLNPFDIRNDDFDINSLGVLLSEQIGPGQTVAFATNNGQSPENATDFAFITTRSSNDYPNVLSIIGACRYDSDNDEYYIYQLSVVQVTYPFTIVKLTTNGRIGVLQRRPEWSSVTFDEYSIILFGNGTTVPYVYNLYPFVGYDNTRKMVNFYLADFSGEVPVPREQPIELARLQSTELRFCAVYEDGEYGEWTGDVGYTAYLGDGAFSTNGRQITVLEDARSPQIGITFRPVYDNLDGDIAANVMVTVTDPLNPYDPYFPGGYAGQSNPLYPGNPQIPGGSGGTPSGPSGGSWGNALGGTSTPNHATVSSTDTGLFRTYSMTLGQIQQLGQKLWSASILDTVSKYFENPADLIMGILEFPFNLPTGTTEEIKFNWLPTSISSLNVQGSRLTDEYVVLDFGTINIPRVSGTFYDYQPFTTAEVYLPYVGFVPVKYSEIVGSTLHIEYCISLVSGAGMGVITSGKVGIIGTYNAIIGRQLPLTARDFSSVYISIAKAGLVATAGLVGAGAGAAAGIAGNSFVMDSSNFYRPGAISTMGRLETAANIGTQMTGHFSRNFGQSAINSISNANGNITRSGHFDSAVGRCSNQNAFVVISAPHQNLPATYGRTIGYPANIGGLLGQFSGYTEVRSINLVAQGATATELIEIENLLKGGIII